VKSKVTDRCMDLCQTKYIRAYLPCVSARLASGGSGRPFVENSARKSPVGLITSTRSPSRSATRSDPKVSKVTAEGPMGSGHGMRPMGVSTKGDSGTSPMPCWKRRGGEEF
jgi:hypothetical protein